MIETTIGALLINDQLPKEIRDYNKIIDKKRMQEILTEVSHKFPQKYAEIAQHLLGIGNKYSYLMGASFTFSDFKPTNIRNEVYQKYQTEYKKLTDLDKKENQDKLKELNLKVEKEIDEKTKEYIKKNSDTNKFLQWIDSGARGGANDVRQLTVAVGNMLDVRNQLVPVKVQKSLTEGLKPSEFFITAVGARKGIVGSFLAVRDPGAFAKELAALTSDMVVTVDDCGTLEGKELSIDDPNVLDRCLAKATGMYQRNQVITHDIIKNLREKNIKTISVRTPLLCKSHEGVCSKCYGLDETGHLPKVGDTVGLKASQAIGEKLTQMALSEKHSGGVVRKSPFQQIQQLSHMPENFPGGAVLARVKGTISKIHKQSDGTTEILIGNEHHYVRPGQIIKVKQGDIVDVAQPLTDGLVNPAEVVKLKGINAGRETWANEIKKVYNEAGIDGHSKVFETVSRAVINHAQVKDPGDYDLDHGQIIRYNQHQDKTRANIYLKPVDECVGWRIAKPIPSLPYKIGDIITSEMVLKIKQVHPQPIQVFKKPMQIEPYGIGTERGALIKDDWMSNLGFRFLKNTLLDNVATGAKADIHSWNPIPAYVYGAEFGKGVGGKF